MFRVYDYTNATRLFGDDFTTIWRPPREPGEPPESPPPPERIIQVEGFEVHVADAGRYIVTHVDGRAMPVTIEEYKERLAEELVKQAPTLEDFRQHWLAPEKRRQLMTHLPEAGRSAVIVQAVEEMGAYDLYDVLGDLGYGMAPRTTRSAQRRSPTRTATGFRRCRPRPAPPFRRSSPSSRGLARTAWRTSMCSRRPRCHAEADSPL